MSTNTGARRKGNNRGTIVQRSDGRWAGALSLASGKRKWFYGKTRGEVQKKLTAALASQDRGFEPPSADSTIGSFLRRWVEDVASNRVRPQSAEDYRRSIENHIIPSLGKISLSKLTRLDVERMNRTLLAEGKMQGGVPKKGEEGAWKRRLGEPLAPATVKRSVAVLKMALRDAEASGLVVRNVARLATPVRVERREVDPFTPDQARAFLEAVRGHKLEALFVVALSCGLRQGEIVALRWEDLDLEGRILTVRRTLRWVGGKLTFVEPKTEKSRRTIALPRVVVAALTAHRKRQLQDRLLAGSKWQEHGLVFTTSLGTPYAGGWAYHQFLGALKKAGLPRQRFHDLRHACASFLIAQGAHPKEIQVLLGHSTIVQTMDTYGHLFEDSRRELAAKMDALLSPSER